MKLNNFNKTLFALCFVSFTNSASAANITYEATDLADIVLGKDLWKYTYTVSDHIFDINNGFSIFFDPQEYSNLEDPAPAVNIDWDILVFQPDGGLPADGIYDALSLSNGASLADPFMLSFIWSGNGSPGAQSYEIFDASFNIVASGITVSNVPEPTSVFLLASGLIGIYGAKRKRSFKIMGEKL
jgi:hypothetical protein